MPATTVLSGAARFERDAVDALALRAGCQVENPSPEARQLSAAPLAAIAARSLELAGQATSGYEVPERLAERALQLAPPGMRYEVGAYGPAFNRPGDFPNLLAGLANKLLDQAIETSAATYPIWTAQAADLPDFKPATVVGIGGPADLDEIMDDEEIKQAQLNEELAGWIQIGRYGNAVALTPVMVANDDLDGFSLALQSLAVAHEQTLNRLCLALVGGNAPCPDGFALYAAAQHGNDIVGGGGGAPSIVQATAMKLLHRRQLAIGGTGRVKTPPKIALVPSAWEEAAMQTFLSFSRLNESKVAIADATINTFRGAIEPVVEPDLEDYSLTQWYTFSDPRLRRTIVHAFQRGYGRGGKRTSWYDPARKSQVFELEGRFAAAIVSWRGTVRNAGL